MNHRIRTITPMERSVIEFTARLYCPNFNIDSLTVSHREHTGAGRFTQFDGPPWTELPSDPSGIGYIEMEGIDGGLGFVVFSDDSRISELEIFTNGPESWDGTERPWIIVLPDVFIQREANIAGAPISAVSSNSGLSQLEGNILGLMSKLFLPSVQLDDFAISCRQADKLRRQVCVTSPTGPELPTGSVSWGNVEMDGLESSLAVRIESTAPRDILLEFNAAADCPWDGMERTWRFVPTSPIPPPFTNT